MKLPKEIQLGECSIEVRPLSLRAALKFKHSLGLPVAPSGYASPNSPTIYVFDSEGAGVTLIHELIHKMDAHLGIGLTERQVTRLAEGWNALLVCNDFSFLRLGSRRPSSKKRECFTGRLEVLTMLKDYPKTLKLKDGTKVTIRPMEKGDADDLFGFFERVPKEDRLFFKEDVTDRNVIESWARNLDYSKVLPLVALESGTIVADATLHRRQTGWTSHVGKIRLVVDRNFRGKGLGAKMVQELLTFAENAGLDKVVVELMDTQEGAKRSFERLGFKEEAKLSHYVTDLSGKRHDLAILVHSITPMWGY